MDKFEIDKYFAVDLIENSIKYGLKISPISPNANNYKILYINAPKEIIDCITRGEVSFSNINDAIHYKKIIEYHMQKYISEKTN
jgi:hypothetical protein